MRTRPLRTLIVDDEQAARAVLRREIAGISGVEVIGEAEDGKSAHRSIEDLQPDLVLLDIQLPSMDGFEVVRSIRGRLPSIIFVTAYSEHALRAFEVGAVDYLLKPFGTERLSQSIDRVRRAHGKAGDRAERIARVLNASGSRTGHPTKIVARWGNEYLLLDLDKVFAFEASEDLVWILTANKRYRATQTLGALSERLAGSQFLRVHRSVLVNGDKIAKLSALSSRRWQLTLENGHQCIVSKRNAALARALLR